MDSTEDMYAFFTILWALAVPCMHYMSEISDADSSSVLMSC